MRKKIICLLILLKNLSYKKKKSTRLYASNIVLSFLKILYKNGLILSFKQTKLVQKFFEMLVFIRYSNGISPLQTLNILSTPSCSYFLSFKNLCKMKETKKILILSTSRGFLSSLECKQQGLGGKLLFVC